MVCEYKLTQEKYDNSIERLKEIKEQLASQLPNSELGRRME